MTEVLLTKEVASYARSLGADLVGFAPVSRWAKAPVEHSPQGVFPSARNVIVCACHFLDAPTELGAEEDPRIPGPAMTEMSVSTMLQDIGFRVSKFLQKQGHGALFVRQSGAWRYRGANGDRGWVGDICHYYAAACAGLGEVGWNNITLTPEFGPRQRFVSIITDADLTPTPLYDGPPLCDRCRMCAKQCPTQSFEKDVSGKMLCIECEDRKWEFPERNLWRCALGENFMLDVFLDEWKDREVTEELVLRMEQKAVEQHNEWITGWKMGMCLKYCMSKERRYWDRQYCKAPRRRRDVEPDTRPENLRALLKDIEARCPDLGVDFFGTGSKADFTTAGIDIREFMPDAESVIVFGLEYPKHCALNSDHHAHKAAIEIGKLLQEQYGFSALPRSALAVGQSARICGVDRPGVCCEWRTIVTSAPLTKHRWEIGPADVSKSGTPSRLTAETRETAHRAGADMMGIASVGRLDELAAQLRDIFEPIDDYFVVEDEGCPIKRETLWGRQGHPFRPAAQAVKLVPKRPSEHLSGAKSVIVFGIGLLNASIDNAGAEPARKAGHFHTSVHEEIFSQLQTVQLRVSRLLAAAGYRSVPVFDLFGLAGGVSGADKESRVSGGGVDLTASRFAAVAAGLADLGWNGIPMTPEYGPRQRFACLVTDADLIADNVYDGPALCRECGDCVSACPMAALDEQASCSVTLGGRTFRWGRLDRLRCDFAQRYGFVPEEGGQYIGCRNDFEAPEKITPDYVCDCMRKADRIQRPSYTPIVEPCFTACRTGMGG